MINEYYFDMTEFLKPKQIGDFSLENFEIRDNDTYAMLHGIKAGKYVSLKHNGDLLMSNTEMEERTNEEFVTKAHGNVLIGGLGIGMIVLAIQDILQVEKISVIEKIKK